MRASLFAIRSAVPAGLPQDLVAEKMVSLLQLPEPQATELRKRYAQSAILKRHSVIEDFEKERPEWSFFGPDYPKTVPGMSERNALFKKEAPKLAFESAQKALSAWGGDPKGISHILFVTCTGVVIPGVEFHLVQRLGLNPAVNRLAINFMGCFGAFKALAVANALAKESSQNRILIVCTELCSLHFQAGADIETMTANALFSDGSAAAVVGCEPQPFEKPLWEIVRSRCLALENSLDKMSWEASDQGYLMRLSHQVPWLLGRHIRPFAEEILGAVTDCDWAIHPGGKSILQAIEKAMDLKNEQTRASWDILAEYGNMSSATFLFVLERLYQLRTKKWTLGVGFGPGLSMEGILLEAIS